MRGKNNRPFIGQSAKAKSVANDLNKLLLHHKPTAPLTKPIKVCISWQFPFRKSEPKKNRALGKIPCSVRPDLDNLAKLMLDALGKAGFYKDDALVYDLHISKCFSYDPGYQISLTEIDWGGDGAIALFPK